MQAARPSRRRRRPRAHRDQLLLEGIYQPLRLRLPRLRAGLAAGAGCGGASHAEGLHDASRRCRSACCTTRLHGPAAADLSINVTAMFRDPSFYRRSASRSCRSCAPIRSSGSGTRAARRARRSYSIAILLHGGGPATTARASTRPTSTRRCSTWRARGRFPLERMRDYTRELPARRRARGVLALLHGRRRRRALRPGALQPNVVFAQHNLVSDGSFNEFNVIVCRNVMIYFGTALQDRVHDLFYESLVTFGVLALGPQGVDPVHRRTSSATRSSTRSREALPGRSRDEWAYELVVIGASWGGARRASSGVLGGAARRLPRRRSRRPAPQRRTARRRPARCSARTARCPCCDVEDKEPIEPGHGLRRAGRLPPARRARHGSRCRSTSAVRFSRPSIDVLFESAADAYGDRRRRAWSSPAPTTTARAGLARIKRPRRATRSSRTRRRPSGRRCPTRRSRAADADAVAAARRRSRPLLQLYGSAASDERRSARRTPARRRPAREPARARGGARAAGGQRARDGASGEEALRRCWSDDFAVILLDVQMPGLDGFETAELIKRARATADIPIIFLTAISKERSTSSAATRPAPSTTCSSRSTRRSCARRSRSSSSCTRRRSGSAARPSSWKEPGARGAPARKRRAVPLPCRGAARPDLDGAAERRARLRQPASDRLLRPAVLGARRVGLECKGVHSRGIGRTLERWPRGACDRPARTRTESGFAARPDRCVPLASHPRRRDDWERRRHREMVRVEHRHPRPEAGRGGAALPRRGRGRPGRIARLPRHARRCGEARGSAHRRLGACRRDRGREAADAGRRARPGTQGRARLGARAPLPGARRRSAGSPTCSAHRQERARHGDQRRAAGGACDRRPAPGARARARGAELHVRPAHDTR